MKKKKLRPLGNITSDLEPFLLEMVCEHDLQHGEILNLIRGYLEIHCPNAKEEFVDGDEIVFYYGSKEGFKNKGHN